MKLLPRNTLNNKAIHIALITEQRSSVVAENKTSLSPITAGTLPFIQLLTNAVTLKLSLITQDDSRKLTTVSIPE